MKLRLAKSLRLLQRSAFLVSINATFDRETMQHGFDLREFESSANLVIT